MFNIIGGDGKQYGPVTGEQLRQWIAEGRAQEQTMVQSEDSSDWKRLGDLSEFTEVFAARAGRAAPAATPPVVAAEETFVREHAIRIGDCLSRGWALVKRRFWLLVGAGLVLFLINLGLGVIPFLGFFADTCLALVLWAGLDWMLLKLLRGQPVRFGDAFAGFSLAFLPLMLASLVSSVLISLGFILCVMPGLYLMMAWWMFVPLLILDKQMEFWAAMELSRKVVNANLGRMIDLFLVTFLLTFAGGLLLCVGFFVMLVVSSAAIVCAYEDIFGTPARRADG